MNYTSLNKKKKFLYKCIVHIKHLVSAGDNEHSDIHELIGS
jgi:hypothetical protein